MPWVCDYMSKEFPCNVIDPPSSLFGPLEGHGNSTTETRIMGLLDTIKGWLNIGGVKVKLDGIDGTLPKSGGKIAGKMTLTTKSDKTVLNVKYQFVLRRTSGSGDDKETKETVIAERVIDSPFDMKTGETKTLDFDLDYASQAEMKDKGGVLGGLGKMAAFASSEKDEYFVVALADVKGTPLDPSAEVKVTVK